MGQGRLTIVSHPCVVAANQAQFAELAAVTGWAITIITPTALPTEYGLAQSSRWPAFTGDLVRLPVWGSGHIQRLVYRGLRRAITASQPDAIYVHAEPYSASAFQACRVAARLAIPVGFYSFQNIHKRLPPPFGLMRRYVYRRAAFAVPCSQTVATVLRSGGWCGPVSIIPPGVEVPARPLAPPSTPTLGYVGRLSPEKGVDVLLRAAARLGSAVDCIVIAGDGPDAATLRAAADGLGLGDRVQWLGYVPHDQIANSYREMSVLVVPSRATPGWTEQFGRVIIEALAHGVPVVASDTGEMPNLLATTGGGRIFPDGDDAALADVLQPMLNDVTKVRQEAQSARAIVKGHFSHRAVAEALAGAIRSGSAGRLGQPEVAATHEMSPKPSAR